MEVPQVSEKIQYYDCFSGISGDMNLGAMVDLGVPQDHLGAELAKLGLEGYSLRFTDAARKGIHGARADVSVKHEHGPVHEHRSFADIARLIEGSTLSLEVKKRSLAIFRVLAKAESKVHDRPIDQVHFHEVSTGTSPTCFSLPGLPTSASRRSS